MDKRPCPYCGKDQLYTDDVTGNSMYVLCGCSMASEDGIDLAMDEVLFFDRSRIPKCGKEFLGHKGPFEIIEDQGIVQCRACEKVLSPMYVLIEMSRNETRWHHMLHEYKKESEKIEAKRRVTCEHCGKMTSVLKR